MEVEVLFESVPCSLCLSYGHGEGLCQTPPKTDKPGFKPPPPRSSAPGLLKTPPVPELLPTSVNPSIQFPATECFQPTTSSPPPDPHTSLVVDPTPVDDPPSPFVSALEIHNPFSVLDLPTQVVSRSDPQPSNSTPLNPVISNLVADISDHLSIDLSTQVEPFSPSKQLTSNPSTRVLPTFTWSPSSADIVAAAQQTKKIKKSKRNKSARKTVESQSTSPTLGLNSNFHLHV